MTSNVLPLHFAPSQNSNVDNFKLDCHNPFKIPFKILRTLNFYPFHSGFWLVVLLRLKKELIFISLKRWCEFDILILDPLGFKTQKCLKFRLPSSWINASRHVTWQWRKFAQHTDVFWQDFVLLESIILFTSFFII